MSESIAGRIEREVASWPGVSVASHRYGGVEFRVHHHEIGHLHGDELADVPLPVRMREQIVADGKASPHHVLPDSGWVSRPIASADDVPVVLELFRLSYDRIVEAERRRSGTDDAPAS